ncbi:MAG: hypothetical protein AB1445_02135 [Bacillota bacterium]
MPLLLSAGRFVNRVVHYRQERPALTVGGAGLTIAGDSWTHARTPSPCTGSLDDTRVAILDPVVGMRSLLAMAPASRNFAIARTACHNLGVVLTHEALNNSVIGGGDLLDVMDRQPLDAVFTRPSSSHLQTLTDGIQRQRRAGYAREVVLMGTAELREQMSVIQPTATVDWPGGDAVRQVLGLEQALEATVRRLFHQAPGVARFHEHWEGPIYHRAQAMVAAARCWARLGPDLLGTTVRIYDLEPGSVAVYTVQDGHCFRTVHDVWGCHSPGLARSPRDGVLAPTAGLAVCPNGQSIASWLPFRADPVELENDVANYLLRPSTVPETWRELLTRMAVTRAVARRAAHIAAANRPEGIGSGRPQRVVVTGNTVSGGHAGAILLLVLDMAEPTGVTPIYLDHHGILPGLGALALEGRELEAAEPGPHAPVMLLATCIAPSHQAVDWQNPKDHTAAMVSAGIPGQNPVVFRLQPGMLSLLPLTARHEVQLRLHPAPGYDFGAGSGKVWEGIVSGGLLGLVFDTRGRPLVLPSHEDIRIARMRDWLAEVRRNG